MPNYLLVSNGGIHPRVRCFPTGQLMFTTCMANGNTNIPPILFYYPCLYCIYLTLTCATPSPLTHGLISKFQIQMKYYPPPLPPPSTQILLLPKLYPCALISLSWKPWYHCRICWQPTSLENNRFLPSSSDVIHYRPTAANNSYTNFESALMLVSQYCHHRRADTWLWGGRVGEEENIYYLRWKYFDLSLLSQHTIVIYLPHQSASSYPPQHKTQLGKMRRIITMRDYRDYTHHYHNSFLPPPTHPPTTSYFHIITPPNSPIILSSLPCSLQIWRDSSS